MRIAMDLGIVPVGTGTSASDDILKVHEILNKYDLETNLHAYGTNIEGEWDEVMQAVKECHQQIHEKGTPRIHTTIKIDTRIDKSQSMQERIDTVEKQLN